MPAGGLSFDQQSIYNNAAPNGYSINNLSNDDHYMRAPQNEQNQATEDISPFQQNTDSRPEWQQFGYQSEEEH